MNSLPAEAKITTSCEECIFAEINAEGHQSECMAGRLLTFLNRGEATVKKNKHGEDYYEINRVCNISNTQHDGEDPEERLKELREKIKPSFGIVVYDTLDDSDLEKTIDSIKNIEYDPKKVTVVISSYMRKDVRKLVSQIDELKKVFPKSFVNFNTQAERQDVIDYLAFNKCANRSMFLKLEAGTEVNKDVLSKIDRTLNEDLEKVMYFDLDGGSCVFSRYVKQNYLKYGNYRLMEEDLMKLAISQKLHKVI